MVYNKISTKNIISKVLRDLDYQEGDFRISDMIEWIGEGIRKIGAVKTLDIKITGKEDIPLLQLSDYQCQLPNDLYKLIGVAYSPTATGTFIPLRYGTGTYDSRGASTTTDSTTTTAGTNNEISLAMLIYDLSYEDAVDLLNGDSTTKDLMSTLLADSKNPTIQDQTSGGTYDYTYVINNSYIKTNIKTGYLMLAYTCISVDEDGYPLIPDDEMFSEALYWYIVHKLLYPKWLMGQIRDRIYESAKRSWNFYRKAAYAAAMMPNIDQLESLKNQSLKLYPEINDFSNFFNTTGEQQIVYTHNYNGSYTGRYR